MREGYRYAYDPEANALYIYVRAAASVWQKEHSRDIVGIEVLNPGGADLRAIVGEYDLDPHLLDVLEKLRSLMPEARKQLVLA